MDSKRNQVLMAAAAIIASGVLLFWGTGLEPRWWMMWLAPLPVLLVSPRLPGRGAFATAVVAWSLGGLNMWRYFLSVSGGPNPGIGKFVLPLIAIVTPACIFGLAVVLWRAFARRGALWRATLALPAVWVAHEYLLGFFWPHGTWGSLAYTQVDFLPFLQLASVTGVWGMSFVLLCVPAAVAAVIAGAGAGRTKQRFSGAVAVMFAAVLLFGWVRLQSSPEAESVTVGLISSDAPQNLFPQKPDQTARLIAAYIDQIKSLAKQGAQVIVLPEKVGIVLDPDSTAELDQLLGNAAQETGSEIVVGVSRKSSSDKWNEARVYSPQGGAPLFYEKEHMLPAFESGFKVGSKRVSFNEPSGKWGVAICKDMDFPALSRQYGKDGVGLMLVPAWDFVRDGWLHGRMAVVRAVESGFSIARSPKQGVLTLNDDRGRVLAERSTSGVNFATLVASVPVRNDDTLYRHWGNWFAWLALAVLGWLLISAYKAA